MIKKVVFKSLFVLAAATSLSFFANGNGSSVQITSVTALANVKKVLVCKANKLNVRVDAGTDFNILFMDGKPVSMVLDQEADVLGEKNGWYQVRFLHLNKQVTGYVIKDYVEVKEVKTAKKKETKKKTVKKSLSLEGIIDTDALRVREGAGTAFPQVKSLTSPVLFRKHEKVTITGVKLSEDGKRWYRIKGKFGEENVSGYGISDYIKLNFSATKTVKAAVDNKNGILLRTGEKKDSPAVTNKKGKKIKLLKGKTVAVQAETAFENAKVFKISFRSGKETYVGFADALDIRFVANVTSRKTKSDKTESATKAETKPETKPETGTVEEKKPDDTSVSEKKNDEIKKTDEEITSTDSAFKAVKGIVLLDKVELYNEPAANAQVLTDKEKGESVKLPVGQEVKVRKQYTKNGVKWYLITYEITDANGIKKIGAGFLTSDKIILTNELVDQTTGSHLSEEILSDEAFLAELTAQGFPTFYIEKLMELHKKHPGFRFQARHLSLDWEDAIRGESKVGLNLIYNSKNVAWKSLEKGAYNWKNDSFTAFDGSIYVTASEKALRYYMDPRNFLNENDIYQFELLSYNPLFHTEEGIEKILAGSPMEKARYGFVNEFGEETSLSYAETFLLAGIYSGVSPYHLASKAKQEVAGGGKFSNSASGSVAGFEGIYNFYNIGASDSTKPMGAVLNGLHFAKFGRKDRPFDSKMTFHQYIKLPWDNPYKSIVGGAAYIGDHYIKKGQDTVFLEKFNLTEFSTFFHQYMSNIEGPYRESAHTKKAYKDLIGLPLVFSIPVLPNMPEIPAPMPEDEGNPNNWLSSLAIKGYLLTPGFSPEITEYSVLVGKGEKTIEVLAEPVSKLSTVSGHGTREIQAKGETKVEVVVEAENKKKRSYVIRLAKEK